MKTTSSKVLYFVALVLIILGIVFCCKGFNKKNDYSYDNQYVGGDAYNYIINGTYFSGYSSLAAGMFIIAAIFISTGIIINVKEECTDAILYKLEKLQLNVESPKTNSQPALIGSSSFSNSKLNLSSVSNNSDGKWICSDCGEMNPKSTRICRGCGKEK